MACAALGTARGTLYCTLFIFFILCALYFFHIFFNLVNGTFFPLSFSEKYRKEII